jgi:hypothetical protein
MNMTKISRELMTSLTFRPFSKNDYYGFSGVSSPIPMIAENEDEGILMIVDGDYAELYAYDGDGAFDIIDQVDSIRDLPYEDELKAAVRARVEALKAELARFEAELN